MIDSLPGDVPDSKPAAIKFPAVEAFDSKYIEAKGEPLTVVTSPEEPEVAGSDAPLTNGNRAPEESIVAEQEAAVEAAPGPEELLPRIEEGTAVARYTFKAETDSELSFRKVK